MPRIMTDIDHIKITKANKLVEVKLLEVGNRLKLRDQKVVLAVVGQMSPEDEDFKHYQVTINELVALTGITSENLYRDIDKICLRLMSSVITIKEPGNQKGFLMVTWFSHSRFYPDKGCVEFSVSPELKPYLLQVKNQFTTYSLNQVVHLKSTYSIRLYELLRQFLPVKGVNNGRSVAFREITVTDLREYLGVEKGRYSRFVDFRRYILDHCQKELAEHTDLKFEYTLIRAGRRINSINFKIEHNEKFVEVENSDVASVAIRRREEASLAFLGGAECILSRIPDATNEEVLLICSAYSKEVILEGLLDLIRAKASGGVKGSDINYYKGILKNKRREDQVAVKPAPKTTEEKLSDRSWAEGIDLD